MASSSRALTESDRAALLRYEALHEEWRAANERALEAERRLWAHVLRTGGERPAAQAAEAARLRRASQEAYLRIIDALRNLDP